MGWNDGFLRGAEGGSEDLDAKKLMLASELVRKGEHQNFNSISWTPIFLQHPYLPRSRCLVLDRPCTAPR